MGQHLGNNIELGGQRSSGALESVHAAIRQDPSDATPTDVDVRILRQDLAGLDNVVRRMQGLVRLVDDLRDDHLVAVHEMIIDDTRVGIVTDHVEGVSLRDALGANGTLVPAAIAQIGAGIATALATLHTRKVQHLAVKPENVVLVGATAWLTGHCVAPALVAAGPRGREAVHLDMGQYIAPELIVGGEPSDANDMYSLGIVLYEMYCGVTPFADLSSFEVGRAHQELVPGRPEEIPPALWEVISLLLDKNPANRPTAAQTAVALAELVAVLSPWTMGTPLTTPPPPTRLQSPAFEPPPVILQERKPMSRRAKVIGGVAALAVVVLVVWLLATSGSGGPPNPTSQPTPDGGPITSATLTTTSTTATSVVPTVMPNVIGKSIDDAKLTLTGIEVDTTPAVVQGVKDGTVTAQDPPAGSPIAGPVKLTVARGEVPQTLDRLKVVDGQWDTATNNANGVISLSGKQYLNSLTSYVDGCSTARPTGYAEYNLSKAYHSLTASVGLGDDAKNDSLTVELKVFADSRPVADVPVAFGKVTPLNVDLSDVLRLRVEWQVTSKAKTCDGATLVLGTPTLFGFPELIPTSGVPVPTATAPSYPYSTTTTTG